jgi:hypothetical protein
VSGVLFFVPVLVRGQVAVEPSYEVSFHLLTGSNDATSKGSLPANLSNLSQRLKSNFAYSNYRLSETILARMSNLGDFQYKAGTNIGAEIVNYSQSFLELTINGLKSGQTAKGTQSFQVQSLRIGARVPIPTGSKKDEDGKERVIVNYEQIGITFNKFGLSENIPTLIGTLEMPGAKDTLFLIMTVKPVDL